MLLCPISLLCYVLIIALFLYKIIDIAYLMKSIYSTRYFSALGLSGKVSVYFANSKVAFNNSLEWVMEQKWITMFQSAYKSWVDWRRTGFLSLQRYHILQYDGQYDSKKAFLSSDRD